MDRLAPVTTRRVKRPISLVLLFATLLSLLPFSSPPVAATPAAASPVTTSDYTVTELLGPGGAPVSGVDLNNAGQAIGTMGNQAYFWDSAGNISLIPGINELDDQIVSPRRLNERGQVIGYAQPLAKGISRAFRYENGALRELLSLGGNYAVPHGLNDAGEVVGMATGSDQFDRSEPGVPVRWSANNQISRLNTGLFIPRAINNNGEIISADGANVVVSSTRGPLPAGDFVATMALNLNDAGAVVGHARAAGAGVTSAVTWAGGTSAPPVALPALGEGNSAALDINAVGQIVGYSELLPGQSRAVLWEDGEAIDLNSRVPTSFQGTLLSAVAINDSGEVLARGQIGSRAGTFLLSPDRAPLVLQRQDRDGGEWRTIAPGGNLHDGAPLRLVAHLRNTGSADELRQLEFVNTTTGRPVEGCPTTATVPPTGRGTYDVTCEVASAGLAWFDGDPVSHGTLHTFTLAVTFPDGRVENHERELRIVPRPVVLVPGIAGTYARDDDEAWLMQRGVPPEMLQIDPLAGAYDGILKTLENAGYEPNRDLFIAGYDWRLMPGPVPANGVYDGVIREENAPLTAARISDNTFEYGVDYLGVTLRDAMAAWEERYPNDPLLEVDFIAHSTGGLVSRVYMQSDAYNGVYDTVSGARLPTVRNFIMVGVPNRGAAKAWNPLRDNWIGDPSFIAALSKIAYNAFLKVRFGHAITGPDVTITRDMIYDERTGRYDYAKFVRLYVPTIRALLATFPFLDERPFDGINEYVHVNNLPNERNDLVLDLNAGYDLRHFDSTLANSFVPRVDMTTVIYGISKKTIRYSELELGPSLLPAIATMWNFIPRQANLLEPYYDDVKVEASGDGTVPTISAAGQFVAGERVRLLHFDGGPQGNTTGDVSHLGLLDNPDVQRAIFHTVGTPFEDTDLIGLGRLDWNNIVTVIVDPVQAVLVDAEGRRLGWTEASGRVAEIPSSSYFGGADGFGVIRQRVDGPLRLEIEGLGGDYAVHVFGFRDGVPFGATAIGELARGERITVPVRPAGSPNAAPVAAADTYTTPVGQQLSVPARGVLLNDSDPDGDPLFVEAMTQPANGAVSFEMDGSFVYTPRAGFSGSDSVTYIVSDGNQESAPATITINVGGAQNRAPTVGAGGPYSVDEGGSVTLGATASDPDGDAVTVAWDLDGDGSFETSGAQAGFSAAQLDGPTTRTVRVQATDANGAAATAEATVTVRNVAPAVSAPAISPRPSVEGAPVTASAGFADVAADGPFTCTVDYGDGSGPRPGTVSGATCTGPSYSYRAAGAYTITVRVTDKDGAAGASSAAHQVRYAFRGFFAPVDNLPTLNRVNAGRAIPIRFSLGGNKGLNIFAAGFPVSQSIACDSRAPVDAVEETLTAGSSSLSYDAATGQYTLVWKTERSWAGTCRQLVVRFNDGTEARASFSFVR